jgi:excisionase family DNA binding protein
VSRVERKQPEPFLSADEVAELFGMSRDWVYERALARELPSYKLPGAKRRFLYSELMDAAKRFREGSRPEAS